MKKRKSTTFFSVALVFAMTAAVLMTSCGSSASTKSAITETAAAFAADVNYDMAEEKGMYAEEAETAAAEAAGGTGITDTSSLAPAASVNRKLIKNVMLHVESTDFDGILSKISESTASLGGYIESSNVSGNSISNQYNGSRYAHIQVRIPADSLDSFIKTVEDNGNVINKQEDVSDITLTYSDIESHKKTLEVEQERLWALLEKADSLDAVIALESRLSEIRYQLESYSSQLRLYDNQVAYSTVSIDLSEVKTFTPTSPDSIGTRIQKGFSRSINNLSNAFVNLIVWFASNSPILLVWAIIIALCVLIIKKMRKRTSSVKKEKKPRQHFKPGKKENDTSKQQAEHNDEPKE